MPLLKLLNPVLHGYGKNADPVCTGVEQDADRVKEAIPNDEPKQDALLAKVFAAECYEAQKLMAYHYGHLPDKVGKASQVGGAIWMATGKRHAGCPLSLHRLPLQFSCTKFNA